MLVLARATVPDDAGRSIRDGVIVEPSGRERPRTVRMRSASAQGPTDVLLEESDDSDFWDEGQGGGPVSRASAVLAEQGEDAEARIEVELYRTVQELDPHGKRHLLRVLHNAQHDMEDQPGATSAAEFLEEGGAEKNREFELFEKNIHGLKSFDLLLFRGSDFVSDFIVGLTQKHRKYTRNPRHNLMSRGSSDMLRVLAGGVEFFSHVGICLAPPLLPRDGHYMRRGKVETGAKVLPFVQVRLPTRRTTP